MKQLYRNATIIDCLLTLQPYQHIPLVQTGLEPLAKARASPDPCHNDGRTPDTV